MTDYRKDFIKVLSTASGRWHIMDVFGDACAVMSCAVEQFSHNEKEREERYESIIKKYSEEERKCFTQLLGIVVEALECRRESFLGPVLEEIGAANTRNGQFLTPVSVSNLIGRIQAEDIAKKHKNGELITMNDPACGAGVLMISGAEALLERGVPQRDIFIVAGDIDRRACDITFLELTLLGYSARVEHMNALSMEVLSRPRWTMGFFMHGTQWRLGKKGMEKCEETEKSERVESTTPQESSRTSCGSSEEDGNVEAIQAHQGSGLVQATFSL